MTGQEAEILKLISAFGATGVLFLWLMEVRSQLKEERASHERTRQELRDCLRDCNREEKTERLTGTRPITNSSISEAERQRLIEHYNSGAD